MRGTVRTRGSVVSPSDVRVAVTAVLGAALGVLGLYLAWDVAPVEKTLKMSQKIFYFHAPLGVWTIALSVAAAALGAAYLALGRNRRLDVASAACMEVSALTCGVVLVTGSLWARPAWDDWFPLGEPRLTLMLVLFLIDLAYLVLRASIDEPSRRARLSAVLAVVGSFDAMLAYFAIHLWNTQHPRVVTPTSVGLEGDMLKAVLACLAATALMTWALLEARYRHSNLETAVQELEDRLLPGDTR